MSNPHRLGIDIGGTSVKVAIKTGDSCRVASSPTYTMPDRSTLAAAIRSAWLELDTEPPAGPVGLCVPGIPSEDGRSIERAVNLPGLVGWDLEEMVASAIGMRGCRVCRTGDASAALKDWQSCTGAKGRVLGIAIGTGVGLSVLDDGAERDWGDGTAGHLGQVDVSVGDPESAPVGPDGGRGGLEAYVGARAVEAAGGITPTFADGAPGLVALARAIRICHAIYRPNVVVLLGGIGRRLSGCHALEDAVRQDLTSIAQADWELRFGIDDFHAARGVAMMFGL